jgi:uncharacterized membrane protein YraQ (UPF0718 family)
VFNDVGRGLDAAFFMFWETLWALVIGYVLAGAVRAFVAAPEMRRALGDHRPATVARAGLFGALSSSCSYAAASLARSLVAGGADFTTAMVFMVASTNLVIELGLVLWLLIGWQFAVAEFVGGAIMIALLTAVLPRVVRTPATAVEETSAEQLRPLRERLRSSEAWSTAAAYTRSELRMVRRELVIGFVVAGLLAELVPVHVWRSFFLHGHGFGAAVENAVVGPVLAAVSFVCSIGNVPLAAALWHGGIAFGGVVAFVFADLLAIPLIAIYRRYFGTALATRLVLTFWAVMSLGGLATQYLFDALDLIPKSRPKVVVETGFALNYTLVLNVIAVAALAALFVHERRAARAGVAAPAQCH